MLTPNYEEINKQINDTDKEYRCRGCKKTFLGKEMQFEELTDGFHVIGLESEQTLPQCPHCGDIAFFGFINVETEKENEFKELRKGKTEQSIINFINKFINKKPSNSDFRTFLDFTVKSDEIFSDFVRFIDCFDRESKSFKLMRDSVIWGMEHHIKYEQYYRKIISDKDSKITKLIEEKETHLKTIASDDLILKGDE